MDIDYARLFLVDAVHHDGLKRLRFLRKLTSDSRIWLDSQLDQPFGSEIDEVFEHSDRCLSVISSAEVYIKQLQGRFDDGASFVELDNVVKCIISATADLETAAGAQLDLLKNINGLEACPTDFEELKLNAKLCKLALVRLHTVSSDVKLKRVGKVRVQTEINRVINDLSAKLMEIRGEVSGKVTGGIMANRALVYQLFKELVENSVKYRSPDRDLRVTINETKDGGTDGIMSIVYEDNGLGIPEDHQTQVFQSHYRAMDNGVEYQNADAHEGTGIGLSVCERVMEIFGGSIDLQSDGNSYTRFVLKFKLCADEVRK